MALKYRDAYPVDWEAISLAIKDANGWRCGACDVQCTRPGEPYRGPRYMLTCAHVDPNSYTQDFAQLAPLCSVCHMVMDAPFGWLARRRHERSRREKLGQLEFVLEGKNAA